ncbi:sigma-54-dependent Fis family transcriptional regulator [Motiliproteus coralliicola]|uniref:Sigma-54-dependent Fis family transcriptional regulator n=1 Tax=Motiliproteus coralliicola TaxID=2283196 RepID=A0A369WBG7_9GAMM|nr:sigma-54 dependent transcriptional regulator [Motiliproteus coralliicola]RDE18054.1 sigma-54-dependent Fis family transcriptional regulator [Motiliproteus coralliicola]
MSNILIVEDEDVIRTALKKLLERNDYQVSIAGSVDQALEQFRLDDFDLVISDLRLPGREGTDLIELAGQTPVLIMTSYASMRSAIEAMKQGAVDYIAKPFDHEEMLQSIAAILSQSAAAQQPAPAPNTPAADDSSPGDESDELSAGQMLGRSQPMLELFSRIRKVARTDATVLIQGESGTGKELAAHSIHQQSQRHDAPMISVNCAAIPETLIESELFGHEKGAFTGAVNTHRGLIEAANGGTLFLDEIGELPLEAQARLLRVLQEGEIRRVGSVQPMQVDIRLIAATHRDLKALTRTGKFREDLFYRLYIMEIAMPPLRDRGEDIIELANKFLLKACARMGCAAMQLSPQTRQAMLAYQWPGNVRELENAIERAVILNETDQITPELLGLDPQYSARQTEQSATEAYRSPSVSHEKPVGEPFMDSDSSTQSAALSLEDYFQRFVLDNQDQMTETELAKRLGISRKTLWERRQKLGIPRKPK